MKIGILGGSFDPIHNGHLHMAEEAYKEFALDEVWLMPAGHSPNKSDKKMTAPEHRLTMCQLAASSYPYLKASSFEIDKTGISYTYLTLSQLKELYPRDHFYFIMGADSLDYFDQWVHPEIIAQKATILVVNRGEFSLVDLEEKITRINELFPADIQVVNCEKYWISSSILREKLKQGIYDSINLPEGVVSYIKEHSLYC